MKLPKKISKSEKYELSSGVDAVDIKLPIDYKSLPFHMADFYVHAQQSTVREAHHFRELWYVLEGEGYLTSSENTIKISSGDTIFIESHIPHEVKNLNNQVFKALSIWWIQE